MYEKADILKILMERDEMSEQEAIDTIQNVQDGIDELLDEGADLEEIESELNMVLSLEPDYLMCFLTP
jgi:FtsZ-binding cell division protein ZapB